MANGKVSKLRIRFVIILAAALIVVFLEIKVPTTIGDHTLGAQANQEGILQPVTVGETKYVNLKMNYQDKTSWLQTINQPNASFIKVHFAQMDLLTGDYVTVSDPTGKQFYKFPGSDYTTEGDMGFSAISIFGDTVIVELHSANSNTSVAELKIYQKALAGSNPSDLGVVIDRYVHGFPPEQIQEIIQSPDDTCSSNQRRDVACYQLSHPTEYDRSNAVAIMMVGEVARCTAWRVGPNNHMITNEHCINSQDQLDSAEFWFNYQRLDCGIDRFDSARIVSGDTLFVYHHTLDFALFSINDFNLISSFGYLELDNRSPVLGEEIYIPQHGGGNYKEFGIDSDLNTGNVCRIDNPMLNGLGIDTDTGYFCDTAGGSSGSPVLARSSHRVIALHHSGTAVGNTCPPDMNRGVRVDRIWPVIQSYLECPQSDGVILYWNNNYDCVNSSWDPGYRQYTSTGLKNVNDGSFNDRASSIKIPSGWSVRLFENVNGGGASTCRSTNDGDFTADLLGDGIGLNDKVSSIEVFSSNNCNDARRPGDANGDGRVSGSDYVIWLMNYGQHVHNGPSQGDFNFSGSVSGIDYVIWLRNYDI